MLLYIYVCIADFIILEEMDNLNGDAVCDEDRNATPCDILAGLKSTLLKFHTKKSKYACDFCNKKFTQLPYLKYHIAAHIDHKPYSCDVCLKSFVVRYNLKIHMLCHNGEQSYTCTICQKIFGDV